MRLKSEEEAASKARLAEMWVEERRSREAWASAQAERKRRERLIFGLAIGLLVAALVLAIVVAAISTDRLPTPLPGLSLRVMPAVPR
jgi:hypothetical protein